ncbi:endodeoxyribonuclease, partial [Thoreauomyces humboldtii]
AYVKLLQYCKELLECNSFATKRELYYRDVSLFKSQSVVDEIIEDLACAHGVPRHCLNVTASCKGLVFGNLIMHMTDGTSINCLQASHNGTLIPPSDRISSVQSSARFVLVIEKEATFQTLLSEWFVQKFDCVILTGKGYPDLATRQLVFLSPEHHTPLYALVDADPHGIEIYLCYQAGSKAMAFDGHNLACPSLKWIGVRPSHWTASRYQVDFEKLLPLTDGDKRKVRGLLRRTSVLGLVEIRRELGRLLRYGRKSEIEVIDGSLLANVYLPELLRLQEN